MKASIDEYDCSFEISLVAETLEEQVALVRMGINKTQKISLSVSANRKSNISAYAFVPKKRRATSQIV